MRKISRAGFSICVALVALTFWMMAGGMSVLSRIWASPGDDVESSQLDIAAAMEHVRLLSEDIGPRPAGSSSEWRAGDYVAQKLRTAGCSVTYESVRLPDGLASSNVIGVLRGYGDRREKLIIGAHYDSVLRSPGANDNASGVALMLELARALSRTSLPYDVVFIGFGAEEAFRGRKGVNHFGSNQFVAARSQAELDNLIGMVSVDMVGVGDRLEVGHAGKSGNQLVGRLRHFARVVGEDPGYFVNTRSDDAAFARRGVPAAQVRWQKDPNYHKPSDRYEHIDGEKLAATGQMILHWLAHEVNLRS